ncbi:hypothetical protein DM02DRAFT_385846 [Periconia macrospinosa]|uniref:Secreted protein n=1 Tax=Periconia macrospinosa TaxID=97972 RepID=A0A2V1DTZ7_9PLEO|nr:hypothetical protein DM02DRAFT_385846 [Periconia macrospinosa]
MRPHVVLLLVLVVPGEAWLLSLDVSIFLKGFFFGPLFHVVRQPCRVLFVAVCSSGFAGGEGKEWKEGKKGRHVFQWGKREI